MVKKKQNIILGIGAHPDDLEIIGLHGIKQASCDKNYSFAGVTVTDGAGSSRTGKYKDISNQEMAEIRKQEQNKASQAGDYVFVKQLMMSSKEVKNNRKKLIEKLSKIIIENTPQIIYTHNLFDKHPTHVAVCMAVIEALREIDVKYHPTKIYAVEVWRGLDWLPEAEKVVLDLTGSEKLFLKLMKAYKSQIDGGKQYDLATVGRMRANATYLEAHTSDECKLAMYAMDLKPLISNSSFSIEEYFKKIINSFQTDIFDTYKGVL